MEGRRTFLPLRAEIFFVVVALGKSTVIVAGPNLCVGFLGSSQ
jgi:hypothetical protein